MNPWTSPTVPGWKYFPAAPGWKVAIYVKTLDGRTRPGGFSGLYPLVGWLYEVPLHLGEGVPVFMAGGRKCTATGADAMRVIQPHEVPGFDLNAWAEQADAAIPKEQE